MDIVSKININKEYYEIRDNDAHTKINTINNKIKVLEENDKNAIMDSDNTTVENTLNFEKGFKINSNASITYNKETDTVVFK